MKFANYAASIGATHLLRGIRDASDFKTEKTFQTFNRMLQPKIETVFLITPSEYSEISSSSVKAAIGPDGWEDLVQQLVPPEVFEKIVAKFKKT